MPHDKRLTRRRVLKLAGLTGVAVTMASPTVAADPASEKAASAASGLILFPLVDTLADTSPSAAEARVDFDSFPMPTMKKFGLEPHKDQWLLFASMRSGDVLVAVLNELETAGFPKEYIDEWAKRVIAFVGGGWPCGDPYELPDADCKAEQDSNCNDEARKAATAPLATPFTEASFRAAVKMLYGGPAPKAATAKKTAEGQYRVFGEGFLPGALAIVQAADGTAVSVTDQQVTGTFRCSRLSFKAGLKTGDPYKVWVVNVWPGDNTSQGAKLGPASLTG